MRNPSQSHTLARKERFPPFGAPDPGMFGRPVDEMGGILIGTHEQNLVLAMQVDDGVFDSGRVTGEEQIQDGVDVFFECDGGLILLIVIEEDDAFCASFGDILVLALLSPCEIIILVKQRAYLLAQIVRVIGKRRWGMVRAFME